MRNTVGVLLLASFILAIKCNSITTPTYTEVGDCEGGEPVCSYSYFAHQEHFSENDGAQTSQVEATVDVTCLSRGVYNDSDANLYCLSVRNVNIMSNLLENSTDEEIKQIQQSTNDRLRNWFCFIQTSSGKIPAVYHSSSEPDDIISLKKAIAAGFQANFLETEEEEETDPQSKHVSHYTYTPTNEEGLLKMKRTIRKEDIDEYASEEVKDDIDTTKDEEIVYRSGRLEKSSGRTTFHFVNSSDNADDDDNNDSPNPGLSFFSAHGSYKMEVLTCHKINKYMLGLQRKHIFKEMEHNLKEEGLTATLDKRKEATEEMKTLREKLPYGSVLTALQNYNEYGDKLVQILLMLVELELEYGVVSPYTPAIDDILTFMTMLPSDDRDIREDVIILLSAEGSITSQQAILRAYNNALDTTEANRILVHISFMRNVDISFVLGMEERLQTDNKMLSDQLLLVFASLAMKGSAQVEDRVIGYLRDQVTTTLMETEEDWSHALLLLHALGNTGSKMSIPLIFGIHNASMEHSDYDKVRLVVIESLSKLTDNMAVLTALEELLLEDSSAECMATVIECLDNGFDYVKKNYKENLREYAATVRGHTVVHSLTHAVTSTNDTDLHHMMEQYLRKIGVSGALLALIRADNDPTSNRRKRGTSYWASSHSDYNLVESLSTRQSDMNTYNRHRSYLNRKTIGIDKANIKVAYGYFAGTNSQCSRMKTFGRMKVVGTLISETFTLAEVKLDMRASFDGPSGSAVAYAKIGSNTLLDYSNSYRVTTHCRSHSRQLSGHRLRIFHFRFYLFIYVGSITLRVDLYAHFDMGADLKYCVGRSSTEVSGAVGSLTPTVGASVTGGVSASLLSVVRGGIDVTVRLNYRLEPAVSVQGCPAYCSPSGKMCIHLFDSQTGSNINVHAWYQTRRIGMCGSWIRYPCIKWGRRHTWDSLSESWSIGRQDRSLVWERCSGNLHYSCDASVLLSG